VNINDCIRRGLLRKVPPDSKSVEQSLVSSDKFIRATEQNIDIRNFGIAIFCAYTSMFHAARSILFRDGYKEHSHVCVVIYLRERYPELALLARMLDQYRMSRHTSLYSLDASADESDATLGLEDARGFRKDIRDFLEGTH
jgi:uncharacterized protein (UPF0332 family)